MRNAFEERVFAEGIGGDVQLLYCGRREKNYSHAYPPHVPARYILTLVVEGEATMTLASGRTVSLKKGCFYAIFSQSGARYESRVDMPWSIKWVVMSGEAVEEYLALGGLTRESPVLALSSPEEVEGILDRLFRLFDSYSSADRVMCLSLVYRLFSLLAEQGKEGRVWDKAIGEALSYLETHYREPITVDALAARCGYHPNYFIKRFKAEVGTTPGALILRYRLEHAKKLLAHSECTVGEIAEDVGFADPLYFSRAFRARYGMSPTAYRSSLAYLT